MMARVTFVAIWELLFHMIVGEYLWLQSGLIRSRIFSYGSFTRDAYHQLVVTKLQSFLVKGTVNCAFKCVGEPRCLSFNLAANPDSDGLYLCDLIATDKYKTEAKEFQASDAYHHYSPWVRAFHLKQGTL